MKSLPSKLLASAALAVLAWLVLAGATAPRSEGGPQPDKFIIISTTDVKGKTSPCG